MSELQPLLNLNFISLLPLYDDCKEYEFILSTQNDISFDKISKQHLGNYLLRHFIKINGINTNNHSIDLEKIIFPKFLDSSVYKIYIQCITYIDRQSSSFSMKLFTPLFILGRGAFGTVHVNIKNDTGYLYAVKCFDKRRVKATCSVENVIAERNILSKLNSSPFVTGLKYSGMDDDNLYFVMDLLLGNDMKFYFATIENGRLSEREARFYAAELVLALEHIHRAGIIYRDLCYYHIMLDINGHCKLCDFGLSVEAQNVRGYAGNPGNMAPEIVLGYEYDKAIDFYSLGVVIFRFLSGFSIFNQLWKEEKRRINKNNTKRRKAQDHDFRSVTLEPLYPSKYFNAYNRSLIKGLLCKNYRNRLTSIEDIKGHPWFYGNIDFQLLESQQLDAPIKPCLDDINRWIENNNKRQWTENNAMYSNVLMDNEFEERLSGFSFISSDTQQKEIVNILNRIYHIFVYLQYYQRLFNLYMNVPMDITQLIIQFYPRFCELTNVDLDLIQKNYNFKNVNRLQAVYNDLFCLSF